MEQLRLFPAPKPLEERLGKEFFAAVPRSPGVYLMSGSGDRLLYVGESSNLRARLASYKNARPDHAPRKVIRLIHEVRRIVWERCETKEAAKARESELLLTHRPKFNRAGTFPRTDWHLVLEFRRDELKFSRQKAPPLTGENFGPFKNGITLHSALVRCVWVACCGASSPTDFAAGLTTWRIPSEQRIPLARISGDESAESLRVQLSAFLMGKNAVLLDKAGALTETRVLPCLRPLITEDLQWLRRWHASVS